MMTDSELRIMRDYIETMLRMREEREKQGNG
jgi:hypothetical protein